MKSASLATLALALPLLLRAQDAAPAPGTDVLDATPRAVFLVRHAEKAAEPGGDPELSAEGSARAEELARVLGDAGVTHLFCTEFQRTRLTLAPLAERAGVGIVQLSARDLPGAVRRLRELPPGAVAVVAGHSNTVPALVQALGGELAGLEDSPHGRVLSDDAYDRLPLVLLPARSGEEASARVLDLRYGAPQGL